MAESTGEQPEAELAPPLPRVTIRFCTQCKWMLRAAYLAQELLSTFGTALGEVALQPGTGGVFVVEVAVHAAASSSPPASPPTTEAKGTRPQQRRVFHLLWDRKRDGGFPETKELKRRVRDVIAPGRDLGHVDRDHRAPGAAAAAAGGTAADADADADATTTREKKEEVAPATAPAPARTEEEASGARVSSQGQGLSGLGSCSSSSKGGGALDAAGQACEDCQ